MAKLKLAPGVAPIRNEHCGCTFQNSRIGQTMMTGQKNDRARQKPQINKQYNLMTAVTNWRNLSAAAKNAWVTFAANYPQPCKNPDSGFLTGYQLFIKRQQYLFLNEGIQSEFLEAPFSEVLVLDNYTFTVDQTENCLDVTENYIKHFGLIPSPGQFLLIKVLAYSVKSGQFFPVVTQTIEILESYIDGLFISLHLPANCRDTVFSVYLSKPVNQSVVYSGTKTRYMGCFTTKTFLELTDTPDSYVGQSGKKVKVKADESGLEFVPDTGGGLTCETLAACPKITSIDQSIIALQTAFTGQSNQSIPLLKYGFLYNFLAITDPRNIAPVGFRVPTLSDWQTLFTTLGGTTVAGGKLKETGTTYWLSQSTGCTNSSKLSLRGGGYRFDDGRFYDIKNVTAYLCTPQLNATQCSWIFPGYSVDSIQVIAALKRNGAYIRFIAESGSPSIATGNDGKVYPVQKVGTQYWTSINCAETKWRNGEWINGFSGGVYQAMSLSEWNALTVGSLCVFSNDLVNL